MGRPPIGERAMTASERQRRRLAHIRDQAAAAALASPPVTRDGRTIRVWALANDPVHSARWLVDVLGDRAQAFGEAYNEALADRVRFLEREAEEEEE